MSDTELKAKHRKMWASGDYPGMVETFLLPLGPRLVEAAGIHEGQRVLDIAAGTGNASIPAAQTGATVTASDLVPDLLEAGRRRAETLGVELEWTPADAENLPFEDESYDVVMSSIGAMFAPFHEKVADEMVRVAKPGGTIALLSWTPEGMIGALFKIMGGFAAPPPPGATPPPRWGSEDHVRSSLAIAWSSRPSNAKIWRSPRSSGRATTASTSKRSTDQPLPPGRTPRRTDARRSSTRRSTTSATSGTAGRTRRRVSRRSF